MTTLHKKFSRISAVSAFLLAFSPVAYTGLPAAKAESQVPQQIAQSNQGNRYPKNLIDDYMKSCRQSAVKQGVSQQQAEQLCACTINRFQAQFTLDQFKALTLQAQQTGETPEVFTEIGVACAEQLTD